MSLMIPRGNQTQPPKTKLIFSVIPCSSQKLGNTEAGHGFPEKEAFQVPGPKRADDNGAHTVYFIQTTVELFSEWNLSAYP